MKNIWRTLLSLFSKPLQLFEERKQINLIHSVGKDDNGHTVFDVIPIGSDSMYQLHPHNIMETPFLKNQFRQSDINIVKTA